MKKAFYLMAAAVMLFAGCAKEMVFPEKETPIGMKKVTLKASYDSELTRTVYEGDKTLSWTAGDKIGVGVKVGDQFQTIAFDLTDGAGSASGTFTGEIPENGEMTGTAFFPWNGEQSDDAATGGSNVGGDGNVYFHLFPETAWTEGSAPLLLAAQFEDPNAIVFKQAAGAVKITLKDVPADADKLVLTVEGKEISGWFALSPDKIGTGAIGSANSSTGTSQLAYTFDTAEEEREMTFYFPVPAIELPSIQLELFAGNSSLWASKKHTTPHEITRGKILRMPALTVEVPSRTFYLVGYFGGADYYGDDYKFDKDGKLTVTFPEGNNYVYVKRGFGGDGNNFFFSEYCTEPSGIVYHYNDGQGEKMLVLGGKKLEFTLEDNGDNNSMTLSYKELALGLTRVWGMYSDGENLWTDQITGVSITHPDKYGMARGLTMDDEYIYLPKSSAYANVAAVSIADNTVQKALSKTGISGGSTFVTSFVRMIKNTDPNVNSGKDVLLLCNLTATESDANQLRLYAYKDGVDAAPTQIAGFCWDSANNTNDWRRYGDRFFVEGDWSSAKVYFPSFNANKTVVLSIANGARTAVTQIAAGAANSPDGIKDLTVYPGDNKLFLTNGSIANLVAPTGSTVNGWNEYTLSASCSDALNTWGYNFFEFEGKKYIAYARIIGASKAQIEVIEDKGDLISSLTAKEGLMVSPIHDATDLEKEVATGNLADCCVRVIGEDVYIAALTRDGGFVLDKLGWK